jgi:hypothetical protein
MALPYRVGAGAVGYGRSAASAGREATEVSLVLQSIQLSAYDSQAANPRSKRGRAISHPRKVIPLNILISDYSARFSRIQPLGTQALSSTLPWHKFCTIPLRRTQSSNVSAHKEAGAYHRE